MSAKLSNKSKINKILLISLTNIGDVILTFPVIDILKKEFPAAKLSIVIGPKAESLLKRNPFLEKVYVFDKHQSFVKSLSWIFAMKREHFDLVIDLRNTAIPFMLSPRYRTSCWVKKTDGVHMMEKHLERFRSVFTFEASTVERCALFIPGEDEYYVDQLIEKEIGRDMKYVIVAPGAADRSKRWPEEGFAVVCDRLIKDHHIKIVFVGDDGDRKVAQRINKLMEANAINLCGCISLVQLAQLLRHCFFTIVNDSAPMHLASYLNVPVIAFFGPTDPSKYGPWGTQSFFFRKNGSCRACAQPKASLEHTCMNAITPDDALTMIRKNITEACTNSEK